MVQRHIDDRDVPDDVVDVLLQPLRVVVGGALLLHVIGVPLREVAAGPLFSERAEGDGYAADGFRRAGAHRVDRSMDRLPRAPGARARCHVEELRSFVSMASSTQALGRSSHRPAPACCVLGRERSEQSEALARFAVDADTRLPPIREGA